jgi:hypothetical protein
LARITLRSAVMVGRFLPEEPAPDKPNCPIKC